MRPNLPALPGACRRRLAPPVKDAARPL